MHESTLAVAAILRCPCKSKALAVEADGVHPRLVSIFGALWQGKSHCVNCKSAVVAGVEALSKYIDSGKDSWGDTNWHSSADSSIMGVKRKHRTDEHVKLQALAGASSESCPGVSSSSALTGLAGKQVRRAYDSYMYAYQTKVLSDVKPQSVSLAFDMARLGKPGIETLLLCWTAS
eukprot:5846379-Amphidinium_carterae.1